MIAAPVLRSSIVDEEMGHTRERGDSKDRGSALRSLQGSSEATASAEHADKHGRFPDPTALGIIGYITCFTPLTMYLMSFGSTSYLSSTVSVGPFFMLGGVCLMIAGLMDWFLGEAFGFLVYTAYGAFYASLGIIEQPSLGIAASFSDTGSTHDGYMQPGFADAMGIYLVCWGFLTIIFLLASMRTNVAFVVLFFALCMAFFGIAAAYFRLASGQDPTTIFKIRGAFGFASCISAWYIAASLIFVSASMPFELPLGDLSRFLVNKNKSL